MSQNNIDFGTFPDDPSADAIRTAFQKVQNNFDQLFNTSIVSGVVTSVNRVPGAGITVNQPTGEVIVSANIACLQVSTSSLKVGRGTDNTQSFVTITSSAQRLNIDINPAQVLSNYFANSSNGLASFNGTLTSSSNTQPNITSVGTLTSLGVSGSASFTGANIYISNIGNFHIPGGNAGEAIQTNGAGNLYWGSSGLLANGTSNVIIPVANGNINLNINSNPIIVVSSSGAKITGVANISGNANVGNLGTSGNISAAYFLGNGSQLTGVVSTGGTANILSNGTSNVNIPLLNGNVTISSAGNANVVVVTGSGANITGTANISGNANVGNLGTNVAVVTTGNITTINSGLIQNSTSNITLSAAGNISTYIGGNATAQFVVTSTGANILGTANVVGNANVGNLGTARVLATANVTAPQLISNVAAGTAPFVVTSTTVVPNLYVARANVGDYSTVVTQTSGIYYPTFVNANISGNYVLASNVGISANAANASLIATTFVGNLSGNLIGGGALTNGTSNVSIPVTNGNVNIVSAGNSTLVVTGTGANITGTANISGATTISGNANVGNLGTQGQLISTLATGTAPIVVSSTTRVPNLNVAYANVSDYNVITAQTTGIYYPTFISGNTTGNYTLSANSGISANVANSALIATTFVGNFYGTLNGAISNGNSNVSIPTANGNVNISAVGNANVLVVTGTGANITGTLNISGNANVGNIGAATAILTTAANVPLVQNGNSNIAITANGNVNITATSNATLRITATGANVFGTANITGNLDAANANLGNLATANYINVSSNITVTGNLSANNISISGSGNISGANVISATTFRGNLTNGIFSNGVSNVSIPAINGNVNISAFGNANVFTVTGTGIKVTGVANITGNANIGNVGIGGILSVTGNANVGNLGTAGQIISTIGTGTAPPFTVSSTDRVANLNVDYANVSDYSVVTTQVSGTFYPVFVNGNSSGNYEYASNANLSFNAGTGNLSTSLLSVTSNANIGNIGTAQILATANVTAPQLISNIAIGNAPLIVTSTTVVPNLYVSRANVSDYGVVTAQTTGIYYPTFINGNTTANYALAANSSISSNIANGSLIATTFVGNLSGNVTGNITGSLLNGNSNVNIPSANGNVTISAVGNANVVVVTGTGVNVIGTANISGNLTAANLIGPYANGNSNINIPSANGNVTISAVGNANVVVVTGTGTVINGTSRVIPKVTPTTVSTPQFTIGESTANSGYQMRLVYYNDPTFGYTSAIQSVTGAAAPALLTLNPSGGNVGIGTANTDAKLDVLGNARFLAAAAGSNGAIILRQNSIDSSGAYIQWTNWNSSSQTGFMVVDITNNMIFGTGNSPSGERIRITASGNVGIANTNPNHTLSVTGTMNISGNANVGNLGTNTATITTGIITTGNITTINGGLMQNGNSNVTITANANITLTASSNSTMVISDAGANIIGTANVSGNLTAANVIVTGYNIRSVATGIVAAGATQGTATPLTKEINVVSTSVSSATGVILPTAVAGMVITVINTSANLVFVYPGTSSYINTQLVNVPNTLPAGNTLQVVATSGTQWYTI
jgi:fibronectin-binding autotransporter adhesin